MRIIFAGTPEFAVAPLRALLSEHSVVAVYTQPDRKAGRGKKLTSPPVKVVADQHAIPVYQPNSLRDEKTRIASFDSDLMVVVAYGMILPQAILDTPRLGCLNIHASILPRWRGAAPIQRAIQAGDQVTGVSIMQMEAGLDTGPVFQVLETPIEQNDTSLSLHDKLSHLGAKGILQTLSKLERNPSWSPTPQDNSLSNYAEKISKSEAEIDWTQAALSIDQSIRAFVPWPVCQTSYSGQRLRVFGGEVMDTDTIHDVPGTILDISTEGIDVACGRGVFRLQQLQRDGGKPMPAKELLNGFELNIGEVFTSTNAQAK